MKQDEVDKQMIAACMKGMEGLVNGLLTAGANIETQDEFGLTGLTLAMMRGHSNVVEVLYDHDIRQRALSGGE